MDYIICSRKRSRPKVAVDVCETCRHIRRCPNFSDYIQPPLFPDLPRVFGRRKPRAAAMRPEAGDCEQKHHQLLLGL
jgi:hypothetical protein